MRGLGGGGAGGLSSATPASFIPKRVACRLTNPSSCCQYAKLCAPLQEKTPGCAPYLKGVFAFNYSALASMGLSASALSGALLCG